MRPVSCRLLQILSKIGKIHGNQFSDLLIDVFIVEIGEIKAV